jgi:predicted metal-dependent enzyme (double-stranded beta helix superfamily)
MSLATAVDHLARARELAARPNDWPLAPRFDPVRRWYYRLVADPVAEAWLLTWLPGQGTDLHDHGGSSGAFVVVSGALTEETMAATGGLTGARLAAGAGRRFGPHHVHRIANTSSRPAISLHVYGPALTIMTQYELTAGGLTVTTVDRAGQDW